MGNYHGAFVTFLGLSFVAFGVAGWVRGAGSPCGCLGQPAGRPFGLANVCAGLALLVATFASLSAHLQSGSWDEYLAVAPTATALEALALCLWLNRHLIMSSFRPTTPALRRAGRS